MGKVLVTREIPRKGIEMLEEECCVEVNREDRTLTPEELIQKARDKDGILCLLNDAITREFLAANPQLRVVSNYAVGYNNIDIEAATAQGVLVTNTPDVLTGATADLTWALILGVARRLVEGDRLIRSGEDWEWTPTFFLGQEVHHKTLGIVGLGRIGQAVARRAQGFSMEVLYHNRKRLEPALEEELGVKYCSFKELLASSDFISIHVPLTEETRHLFGMEEFKLMKSTAYLINTARGPIVNEDALVQALYGGQVAGAGLDVYEEEPQVHPGLISLNNVVLLPHVGSATDVTRERMAEVAVENLLAALRGKRPPHLVNPQAWKG